MALAAIVIFGAGFLYSLYQENEYKVSDKREKFESNHEGHSKLPEVTTIMEEIKSMAIQQNEAHK
ncbi:MAG: hypothetical protein PG981_000094 [Wolbachia endosymbiont of Ctenocephalides orientis wCori]|nr:MAG: hypothetical protein PG981_000094 [Wolbachia endosymbiont of Ctenocephalides orientis wCori]